MTLSTMHKALHLRHVQISYIREASRLISISWNASPKAQASLQWILVDNPSISVIDSSHS